MSELTPEIAAEVVAACEAGAEEAAGALSRSLDAEFAMTVGEAGSYLSDDPPSDFDGAGLAVMMKFGDIGAVALLPEASGLLPDWYAAPDPTGESKLSTMAQELSMLLVPETFLAEDFRAARVESLSEALASAEVADEAAFVPLELSVGEKKAQLTFIWPVASPEGLFPKVEEEEEVPVAAAPGSTEQVPPAPVGASHAKQPIQDFSQLPGYSQSLLRIKLPVHVVLASKKENLQDIVELASGTIIKFEKACDELLYLRVGDQRVAEGEAVKVGDKFGFRVSNIVLPDESFVKVRPKKTG